jgi:hypothetical protein
MLKAQHTRLGACDHRLQGHAIAALLEAPGATVAFHEPPASPHYEYLSGSLSPVGDALLPLLRSLTHHGGLNGARHRNQCDTVVPIATQNMTFGS